MPSIPFRVPQRRARPRAAAFTLIELLAVLIIISILAWVLVSNVTGAMGSAEVNTTRTRAQQISLALRGIEDDQGEPPRSTLPAEAGVAPNSENLGGECLYLALYAPGRAESEAFDDFLVNTDGDQLGKRLPGFEKPTLFEIGDFWGNPYAYFHNKDYGREDVYVTVNDKNEQITNHVRAITNEKLGRYFEPNGFQLISAGMDGEFGTDDDVTAPFKVERKD